MRVHLLLALLLTGCASGVLAMDDSGSDSTTEVGTSTDTGSDTSSDPGSDTSSDTSGSLVEGDLCGGDLGACGPGLSCCYPCGVAGCENTCTPTCDDAEPGCSGGCWMYP